MIDLYLALAIILLILGIIGSIIPALPGPVFSILGASIYWWSTSYSTPGPIIFTVIILTGVFAIILDFLAGYYGPKNAGASKKTALMAALASGLLFLVTGPFGIIIGTGVVVLTREIMLGKEFHEALNSSVKTTLALLGSVVAKVGLTSLMLILFLLALII